MADLFATKYFPKDFDEFIGNVEIVDFTKKWATDWKKGIVQKPLLFFGPPGIGKTALAHLIAKEMKWQIFEMNSSDIRNKETIEKIAGAATGNSTLFGTKRLILIDEIDGLQSQDRGGASAIFEIIKNAKNPIILTANDIYGDKKLVSLRTLTELKEFKKINYLSIAKSLRRISDIENIQYDDEAIKLLAKNSGGDFRSALLDLESLDPIVNEKEVNELYSRQRKEKIFNVMGKIFKGHNMFEIQEMVDNSDVSSDLLFRWVEENIPRQYQKEDIANAFEILSRGDIFQGRIFRRQHYGFLKYVYFLSTVGISISRSKDYSGWTPFVFPTLLSSLSASTSKRTLRKKISQKIGEKTHCSIRGAMKDISFVSILIENKDLAPQVINFFEFDESEVAFLLNTKKDSKKVEKLIESAKELNKKIIASNITSKNQSKLFG